MDEKEKRTLKEHKSIIAQTVVEAQMTGHVIYELKEEGVLTPEVAESFQNLETTKTTKIRCLLDYLTTRGDGSFKTLMKVLMQLGLGKLVAVLDPMSYEEYNGSLSGDCDVLDDLQCLPHLHIGRPSLPCPPARTLEMPEYDDTINSNPREPLKIRVIPYQETGGQHLDPSSVYRNITMPRGLVFMANYKDFLENQHTSREGSEIDVKNLSLLFSQMGYKIPKQHLNMNKMETIRALREFRSLEDLQNVDSCIVVIMSHGRDEKSFYTSDNNYLTVNDVVERFSNKECPALQKKPKIFIFQYCRGSVPDVGVSPVAHLVNYERGLTVQTDAANAGETVVEKDATYTDMYIVYSTVEGFVSFRHPERGSWLMEAICDVFMNHSCDKELETLMKMVSRKVRQNYTDDGNKQVCEFVQRAFDRHFFFNPEPLNSMGSLNMSALSRVLSESTNSLEGATSPLPFPVYQCRAKLRNISQGTTPGPYLNNNYYATRHRNYSGASNSSERSIEEFDPLDFNSENVATHPRVRSLSGTRTRRRISLPEPICAQHSNCLPQPPKPWQRSFSEHTQGSRGTTPDPHELPDHFVDENMFLEVQDEYENPSEETFDVVDNRNTSWMSGASGGALPKHIARETSVAQTAEMESLDMTGENFPQRINEESQRTRRQGGICHSYSSTVIRQEYEDEELKDSRFKIKRQLSIPSTKETLAKINDVRKFLQVHDSDPMLLAPLQRIESFVNKKKHEGKRRKLESNSLEY